MGVGVDVGAGMGGCLAREWVGRKTSGHMTLHLKRQLHGHPSLTPARLPRPRRCPHPAAAPPAQACEAVGPAGRVVSLEPLPATHALLAANVAAHSAWCAERDVQVRASPCAQVCRLPHAGSDRPVSSPAPQ